MIVSYTLHLVVELVVDDEVVRDPDHLWLVERHHAGADLLVGTGETPDKHPQREDSAHDQGAGATPCTDHDISIYR